MNAAIWLCWLYGVIYVYCCAGTSASIQYGTGAISGFFSNDNVKVGDIVVKKQVIIFQCSPPFPSPSLVFRFNCTCYWWYIYIIIRISSKQLGNPVSHSWPPSLMAYWDLGFKRFRLEVLSQCGIIRICISSPIIFFPRNN